MPDRDAGPWLAIDYGERCVGVAMAHPLTGSARPLPPLANSSSERLDMELDRLIREWRPSHIIVGLPLASDGEDSPMSRRVRKFARRLADARPDVEIELQDERMTSEQAAHQFAQRRREGRARRKDAAQLDSHAAAVILEAWMRDHGKI